MVEHWVGRQVLPQLRSLPPGGSQKRFRQRQKNAAVHPVVRSTPLVHTTMLPMKGSTLNFPGFMILTLTLTPLYRYIKTV